MWGEQWRGEEPPAGSDANGEKAEYCDGLMALIPIIPPSPPPPFTPFPWTPLILPLWWAGEVLLSGATVEDVGDWREKAKVLAGFMSTGSPSLPGVWGEW